MNAVYYFFETIQNFMNQGAWVLYLIFIAVFVLWLLVIERFWYLHFNFKKDSQQVLSKWKNFSPTNNEKPQSAEHTKLSSSWRNNQSIQETNILFSKIRKSDLSSLNILLNKNISFIKTLVALCPLLGLLGTVTGMIAVFEIMSAVGTGNARLMASGVSMATIPTMAGMVAALSGICISRVLENRLNKEKQKLIHSLIEAETK